jgi:hypothetical protein
MGHPVESIIPHELSVSFLSKEELSVCLLHPKVDRVLTRLVRERERERSSGEFVGFASLSLASPQSHAIHPLSDASLCCESAASGLNSSCMTESINGEGSHPIIISRKLYTEEQVQTKINSHPRHPNCPLTLSM